MEPKPLTDKQLSAIANDYGDKEPTHAPDKRIVRLVAEVRRLRNRCPSCDGDGTIYQGQVGERNCTVCSGSGQLSPR